jgi:hypothetical protein
MLACVPEKVSGYSRIYSKRESCPMIQRLKPILIKSAVRIRFLAMPRRQASNDIRKSLKRYLELADSIGVEAGCRPVRVPSMLGIDEDMRDWSFYMVLEHNAIVNRGITAIVQRLVRGEEPSGLGAIDMKSDVMPSPDPIEEQVQAFRASVVDHLDTVSRLSHLRQTAAKRHPVFGNLKAHGWHCMFGLHLEIHRRQAEAIFQTITRSSDCR